MEEGKKPDQFRKLMINLFTASSIIKSVIAYVLS